MLFVWSLALKCSPWHEPRVPEPSGSGNPRRVLRTSRQVHRLARPGRRTCEYAGRIPKHGCASKAGKFTICNSRSRAAGADRITTMVSGNCSDDGTERTAGSAVAPSDTAPAGSNRFPWGIVERFPIGTTSRRQHPSWPPLPCVRCDISCARRADSQPESPALIVRYPVDPCPSDIRRALAHRDFRWYCGDWRLERLSVALDGV